MFIEFHNKCQALNFIDNFIKSDKNLNILVVAPAYQIAKEFIAKFNLPIRNYIDRVMIDNGITKITATAIGIGIGESFRGRIDSC